jgi:NifU-like protein
MAAMAAENPIICRCFRVTRHDILEAVRNEDLRTVEEVTAKTNAGGGCSSCYDDIRELLVIEHGGTHRAHRSVPVRTDAETRAIVMNVVRDLIGPLFQLNGVQIQVLEVKGPRVEARLAGRTVGTTLPSILALKKAFVMAMSDACGERMQLIEVNMLDRGIAEDPRE